MIEAERLLLEEFSRCKDWEARYNKLIQMGKTLPPMEDSLKIDAHLVPGCQSKVWLYASLDDRKLVQFKGDSDALLVKGLVAVLIRLYSGRAPQEILEAPPTLIKTLGFQEGLSPSRANGLFSMIKQIKIYATAFKVLLDRQTSGANNY